MYYILGEDGRTPVKCDDASEWARWFCTASRTVANTSFNGITVSTVFLGLDHSYVAHSTHLPVLFETMVFGGEHDGYCRRTTTWAQAMSDHTNTIAMVKEWRK